MVTMAVTKLGLVRPTCFSQTLLHSAFYSLQRGETHAAGVKLLKAARLYLEAMCVAHGIKPAKSTRRIVRQLCEAGGIDKGIGDWLRDIIETGTKCARCNFVSPHFIEDCICLMHVVIDNTPEVDFPTREGGAV